MIKSIRKSAGRALSPREADGNDIFVPPREPGSMPLPTTMGGKVDVERLYGASPEQIRKAAESYAKESRRLLDSVVDGGVGGGKGRRNKKRAATTPEEMERITTRAFEYAAESRRLIAKAEELEKRLGRNPNGPNRIAYDVFQGINTGKMTAEEARSAVRAAEVAGRAGAMIGSGGGVGVGAAAGSGRTSVGSSGAGGSGGGGGPVDADEYLETLRSRRRAQKGVLASLFGFDGACGVFNAMLPYEDDDEDIADMVGRDEAALAFENAAKEGLSLEMRRAGGLSCGEVMVAAAVAPVALPMAAVGAYLQNSNSYTAEKEHENIAPPRYDENVVDVVPSTNLEVTVQQDLGAGSGGSTKDFNSSKAAPSQLLKAPLKMARRGSKKAGEFAAFAVKMNRSSTENRNDEESKKGSGETQEIVEQGKKGFKSTKGNKVATKTCKGKEDGKKKEPEDAAFDDAASYSSHTSVDSKKSDAALGRVMRQSSHLKYVGKIDVAGAPSPKKVGKIDVAGVPSISPSHGQRGRARSPAPSALRCAKYSKSQGGESKADAANELWQRTLRGEQQQKEKSAKKRSKSLLRRITSKGKGGKEEKEEVAASINTSPSVLSAVSNTSGRSQARQGTRPPHRRDMKGKEAKRPIQDESSGTSAPSGEKIDAKANVAVKNSEAGVAVKNSEAGEAVKNSEAGEAVKNSEAGEAVKNSEAGEAVKNSEAGEAVKNSEAGVAVKDPEAGANVEEAEVAAKVEGTEADARVSDTQHQTVEAAAEPESEYPRPLTLKEREAMRREMDLEARSKIASFPDWGGLPALARPGLSLVPSDDALFLRRSREDGALSFGLDLGKGNELRSDEEDDDGVFDRKVRLPRFAAVEVEDDVNNDVRKADTMPYMLNREDILHVLEKSAFVSLPMSSFDMPGAHRPLDNDRKYVRSRRDGTSARIAGVRDDHDVYHVALDLGFHKALLEQWKEGQDLLARLDALAVENPQLYCPPRLERNLSFQDIVTRDIRVPDRYVVRRYGGQIDRDALLEEINRGTQVNLQNNNSSSSVTSVPKGSASGRLVPRGTGHSAASSVAALSSSSNSKGSKAMRSEPIRQSNKLYDDYEDNLRPSRSKYDDALDDMSQSESFVEFLRSKTFDKEKELIQEELKRKELEEREDAEIMAAIAASEEREMAPKIDEVSDKGKNAFYGKKLKVRSKSRGRKKESKDIMAAGQRTEGRLRRRRSSKLDVLANE